MALPELPTYTDLILAYAALGRTWRGGANGYQADLARFLCDPAHERCIVQAPRQAGSKTETTALYDAVAILKGAGVILGMPAQHQASVVTRKRVIQFLEEFERLGWVKARRGEQGFFYSEWSSGGFLQVVSAHQAEHQERRKTSQTGRTGQILHLDEGQSMFDEDVRELLPAVSVAFTEERGKVLIPGVGGPLDSVIEAKKQTGYAVFHIDDERVVAEEPKFAAFFDQMRAESAPEFYDANYKCLPLAFGTRRIFPDLAYIIDPPAYVGAPTWFHGIDVGRTRDFTVISHERWWERVGVGPLRQVVAYTQIQHGNHIDQARWCFEAINKFPYRYRGDGVACETNAEHGLCDILQRTYFPAIMGVNINQQSKDAAIHAMRVEAREGRLQVDEAAQQMKLGDPPQTIGDVTFSIKERGQFEWAHHDGLSAMVVTSQAIGGGVRYHGQNPTGDAPHGHAAYVAV